ncbi:UNVERIFIED_CONTAM: hypothetical protein H355_001290 [Colinus virginianus]|nr:hypothetical protein H355_001290 [Colinus virginianus]
MGQLLWSWVLWGLWVLPEQEPAEPVSSSRVPDSISAERHLDMSPGVPELGMCQLSPGQVEQPSALGDGTALDTAEHPVLIYEVTTGIAVLQTEGAPIELDTGMVPSMDPAVSHHDGAIGAEPHTATVLLSQELDDATTPLVTSASIAVGDTDPAPTTTDYATSSTVPADAGAPHHDGIQKSGTMTPKGTASAVISTSATKAVSEATAPSTDGLHTDTTITHPRVTYQLHATTTPALGTTAMAMDVTTAAWDVSTTPFLVLNSDKPLSVSAEVTSSNAVLQTESVLMGLGMGTVSSSVPAAVTDGSTAERVRGSAVLGMVSSTQASPGTIATENPTLGVPTTTANSESTSAVSAPQTSPSSSASITAQLVTATPGHRHSDAWVTTDIDTDTSSVTTPVVGGAESGASTVTPVSPSAVSSQRPPTALVPVTALPPDLNHSTAEQDVSTSPSVLGYSSLAAVATFVTPTVVASITRSASATGPAVGTSDAALGMVTASSSSVPSSTVALHSPHITSGPLTKATSTPHDPALRTSSTHAWEATAMSWKDTVPSSNAITAAGSARGGSSMVTKHTIVSPPTAKATSTSSAQSPSATRNVLTALRVTNHKATSAFAAISSLTKGTPAATSPTRASPSFGAQRGPITAPWTPAYATSQNPVSKPSTELVPAVSLYPFGAAEGDTECMQRTVDFNCPLLRPEIGFPLGKELRDTIYVSSYAYVRDFTDNGQIIFPPTDSHVPSSPHPPSHGFSGHEALPMVAAFWDDADFSRGVGTTWYQVRVIGDLQILILFPSNPHPLKPSCNPQEYSTLGSTRDPIIRDVEAKIQKYLQVPYSAKWTLKVTWEKAPAYPSQLDDAQTNTYQAVLSTDGSRSFALLLYQDGGMRWDYAGLAARDALIGFSSGDGYAQNSELTQEPPAVRYRPDQHRSSGISKALGEILKPLLGVETEDVRGLWLFRLDSCGRMNYRLQCLMWLQEQPPPSTWSMELPPCPCSLPQAELDPRNSGIPVLPIPNHCLPTDGELEAFEWCCQRVEKPYFCTRYSEKRPRTGCEGYVPPTPASAFGDPHVTTLDGLTYTFNGLGDFMLLLASSAHTSFVLQGRMARTGTAQATNFMAFVAQYTSTTTTTVEWTLGNHSEVQVLLNYKTIQFSYSQDMGAEVYYSPGVLLVNTSSITAIFDGTVSISVSAGSGMLSAVCSLPEQYHNGTKGLLGVWNHNPTDDFQMPNGTNIPVNSSEEEIFIYGMTWAVGEHSLFAQPLAAPIRTFNPIFLSELRQENESQYHLAASQCHGCRECIYDMLSTGDVALGLATQSLVEDFQKRKAVLNAFPPVIIGNPLLTAFRTEQVTRQYRAAGPGVRFVPHISPELNISEDGMLTWEPRGTAPLSVTLQAVSPHLPPALLQLSFTLCSCRSIQQCNYSSTTTVAGSSLQVAKLWGIPLPPTPSHPTSCPLNQCHNPLAAGSLQL